VIYIAPKSCENHGPAGENVLRGKYNAGLYLSTFNRGGVDSLGETEGRQQMTRYLTHQLGGVIPICNHLYCVCTMSMAYM